MTENISDQRLFVNNVKNIQRHLQHNKHNKTVLIEFSANLSNNINKHRKFIENSLSYISNIT